MTLLPPIFRCPDCERVLLIVMDVDDPTLPDEIAVKVDGHKCPASEATKEE